MDLNGHNMDLELDNMRTANLIQNISYFRPGAQFKTKGAVAVGFILFGTSFLFVNSHLTAHQENVKDRVKDLKKISAMLNLPKSLPLRKRHEIFDSYDCCFWCGDLNFRLEQTREEIIRDIEVVKKHF